jgi:hypothetical protein
MAEIKVASVTMSAKGGVGGTGSSTSTDRLEATIKRLIDTNLKLISTIGGGNIGKDGSKSGKSAAATGAVMGLAMGGMMKALDFIVGILMDFAPIVAIMKILKTIIMILLMPLVPLLKPVLMLLGAFAKFIMPIATAQTKLMADMVKLLVDIGKFIWSLLKVLGYAAVFDFKNAGIALDEAIAYGTAIYDDLVAIGADTVNLYATVLAQVTDAVGMIDTEWDTMITNLQADTGIVKTNVLTMAAETKTTVGNMCSEIIKQGHEMLASMKHDHDKAPKNAIGENADGTYILGKSETTSSKALASYGTPASSPSSSSGTKTININVDKPTVSSEADIKKLVCSISNELQKENRRYSSYV